MLLVVVVVILLNSIVGFLINEFLIGLFFLFSVKFILLNRRKVIIIFVYGEILFCYDYKFNE